MMSMDAFALVLKLAGIAMLSGGLILSGISDRRESSRSRLRFDQRMAWHDDRLLGKQASPEQKKLADEYEVLLNGAAVGGRNANGGSR